MFFNPSFHYSSLLFPFFRIRRWSDIDSWTNGEPPAAGDDVTIHPQWLMIVDVSPPPLGRVFVHGALEFEDGRDYNFTANLVSFFLYIASANEFFKVKMG